MSLRLVRAGSVYCTSAWKPLICWPSFVVALMTMIGETYRTISISLTSWSSVPNLGTCFDQRTVLADPVPRRGMLVGKDVELDVLQSVWDLHREPALGIDLGLGHARKSRPSCQDNGLKPRLG